MSKKVEKNKEVQTRGDMLILYQTIKNVKSGSLTKESMLKYIKLRLSLIDVATEFDKMREEISNQTKPNDWKERDSTQEWDKKFQEIMNNLAIEPYELNTHIFTEDECIDLIMSNPELTGGVQDMIMYKLCIK